MITAEGSLVLFQATCRSRADRTAPDVSAARRSPEWSIQVLIDRYEEYCLNQMVQAEELMKIVVGYRCQGSGLCAAFLRTCPRSSTVVP